MATKNKGNPKGGRQLARGTVVIVSSIVSILAIGAIIGIIATNNNPSVDPSLADTDSLIENIAANQDVTYPGADGKNALELLKANYNVETENVDGKEVVKSIDGMMADDSTKWAYYINDQLGTESAAVYNTKNADIITWSLSAVNAE